MKRVYLMCLFLTATGGCAAIQGLINKSDPNSVQEMGKTLTNIGGMDALFSPTIGVWAIALGGLLVGAAKLLQHYKK